MQLTARVLFIFPALSGGHISAAALDVEADIPHARAVIIEVHAVPPRVPPVLAMFGPLQLDAVARKRVWAAAGLCLSGPEEAVDDAVDEADGGLDRPEPRVIPGLLLVAYSVRGVWAKVVVEQPREREQEAGERGVDDVHGDAFVLAVVPGHDEREVVLEKVVDGHCVEPVHDRVPVGLFPENPEEHAVEDKDGEVDGVKVLPAPPPRLGLKLVLVPFRAGGEDAELECKAAE
ncbi:MAG: hypothetical protein CL678_11220 [Bdellovibrionaceae bacterium]|nr:hypothetical protein [Pseudobdellovibrionaceae bacterium]